VALAAGALVAVVTMGSAAGGRRAQPAVLLGNGQKLFTLNDFDTGRVSYPSQNLANGQGQILPPALGGAEHSHVMWGNGFRPFNGGQKLFSIEDFDSGRVSFPEEGMRGRNQVVKSTDQNIDPAGTGRDHVWTHQMSHGPVEYQEWPLEMPGVGDGMTAAAPSPAFKAQTQALAAAASKGNRHTLQLSAKLDKMQRTAALDLGKVGNELQAATQMLLSRPQMHNKAKTGASRAVHKNK